MWRFRLNVFQAVLAIFLATCAIASFFVTVKIPLSPSRMNPVFLHFYQGRFRLFWIQSAGDPLSVTLRGEGPTLLIEPYYPWPALPEGLVGADVPRRDWIRAITIGGIWNVPSFGGAWRTPMTGRAGFQLTVPAYSTFVRLPAWIPCLLLLYNPVRAIIRGVRERYRGRNNLCTNCGYHLFGLQQPRCPECGQMI